MGFVEEFKLLISISKEIIENEKLDPEVKRSLTLYEERFRITKIEDHAKFFQTLKDAVFILLSTESSVGDWLGKDDYKITFGKGKKGDHIYLSRIYTAALQGRAKAQISDKAYIRPKIFLLHLYRCLYHATNDTFFSPIIESLQTELRTGSGSLPTAPEFSVRALLKSYELQINMAKSFICSGTKYEKKVDSLLQVLKTNEFDELVAEFAGIVGDFPAAVMRIAPDLMTLAMSWKNGQVTMDDGILSALKLLFSQPEFSNPEKLNMLKPLLKKGFNIFKSHGIEIPDDVIQDIDKFQFKDIVKELEENLSIKDDISGYAEIGSKLLKNKGISKLLKKPEAMKMEDLASIVAGMSDEQRAQLLKLAGAGL